MYSYFYKSNSMTEVDEVRINNMTDLLSEQEESIRDILKKIGEGKISKEKINQTLKKYEKISDILNELNYSL